MLNGEKEMEDADYPDIRLFRVEHQLANDAEADDCKGEWLVCNPKNLYDFSAVGFIFGRKLHKELHGLSYLLKMQRVRWQLLRILPLLT